MEPTPVTLSWDNSSPFVTFDTLLVRLISQYLTAGVESGVELTRRCDDVRSTIGEARGPF